MEKFTLKERMYLILLLFFTVTHLNLHAQRTVTSIGSGNWSNPSIWDVNEIPKLGDQVVINSQIDYDVNIFGSNALDQLIISGSGSLAIPSSNFLQIHTKVIRLANSATLDIKNGNVVVIDSIYQEGGTLTLSGGNLTIEQGDFSGGGGTLTLSGGNLTV
ncbi:MAG: G8 domain-containing protein [Microscillaceae bacterium]|nr:G8 domain-containing protein [Microscillaceae bacterium]